MRRLLKWFIAAAITGNLLIYLAHRAARRISDSRPAPWAGGAPNAREASPRLWRSGRPTALTYSAAAAAGVTLLVDLRAEGGGGPPEELGFEVLLLPVRDGQAPTAEQVERFRNAVAASQGKVLVHCSAGVGRTGSLVAAHRIMDEGQDPLDAMIEALSVGPPSLEQLAFILGLPARSEAPRAAVAISRVLDAPRRTWSRIRQALMPSPGEPE